MYMKFGREDTPDPNVTTCHIPPTKSLDSSYDEDDSMYLEPEPWCEECGAAWHRKEFNRMCGLCCDAVDQEQAYAHYERLAAEYRKRPATNDRKGGLPGEIGQETT
jgi:hypothetical protein